MAVESGEWRVEGGLKILFILLIGGIGVQTIYAKKDTTAVIAKKETKKVAVKDTTIKAVEKEETVVKVDGVLEVGFDNQYRYIEYKQNKRTTYNRLGKAEVDISLRPVKKVRAEIGFEYNHKDSLFAIDKLYGQYNIANFSMARFGYMKKSFGLEEKAGLDERYFHKRSIINDSLEYFGFLGHDLTLQYRHELGKKLELRGGFSWTEDSLRYLQNYSVEYDDKKNNLLLAAIIRHYLPPGEDAIITYISSLSYKRTDKLFASEAELTYGTNPAIKVYENRQATIFGARLKENFFINTGLNTLQQVIPVAEAVIYSSDVKKDSTDFDTQFRTGLTLGFAKKSSFQWRNNYGIVYKIKEGKKELWRRRFDSEVVIVF